MSAADNAPSSENSHNPDATGGHSLLSFVIIRPHSFQRRDESARGAPQSVQVVSDGLHLRSLSRLDKNTAAGRPVTLFYPPPLLSVQKRKVTNMFVFAFNE